MRRYEITSDKGCEQVCHTSDNWTEYVLTSAYAKDMYTDYVEKYDRLPSSRWYRRHFRFCNTPAKWQL